MYYTLRSLLVLGIVFLICRTNGLGQEILENGGFEEYSYPPQGIGQWTNCLNWVELQNIGAVVGSPDFYHENAPYKLSILNGITVSPKSGKGAMGIIGNSPPIGPIYDNFREYISTKFSSEMVIGGTYEIKFSITNGSENRSHNGYSCDGFGIYFSKGIVTQINGENINLTPQLIITEEIWETEWKEFVFIYSPDSNYNYLTFGSFMPDDIISVTKRVDTAINQTAYYFLDDFAVKRMDPYLAGESTICEGDTLRIKSFNSDRITWQYDVNLGRLISEDSNLFLIPSKSGVITAILDGKSIEFPYEVIPEYKPTLPADTSLCKGNHLTVILDTDKDSIFWFDGSNDIEKVLRVEGNYWINLFTKGCVVSDTIKVKFEDCDCAPYIPSAFTPNGDGVNDYFNIEIPCHLENFKVGIYNRWGRLVYQSNEEKFQWNGAYDGELASTDLYVVRIEFTSYDGKSKSIQRQLTVLR